MRLFAVDAVGGSMRLVQSSRLTEEETKRLFAVDAVGGSMRLLQSMP
jgi:hypothetical protein